MPFPIFLILIVHLPYLSCLVKFHRPQSFNPVPDKPSTLKLSHLKDFDPYQAATRFRHVFLLLSNICTISALPRLLWCVFTTRLILSKNHLFDTSMQTEKFSHISTLHNSTARWAWFWTAVGCHGEVAALYGDLKRPACLEFLWSLSLAPIIFRKLCSSFQHRFSRKILERWSSKSVDLKQKNTNPALLKFEEINYNFEERRTY